MIFRRNSWFSLWIIIEINLIRFIFLIFNDKTLSTNVIIIYILVQNFNSYLYLFFSIFIYLNNEFFIKFIILLLNLTLLVKLGLTPFYIWYPKVINNLNWSNLLILSILQKIIPLYLFINIIYFINNDNIILNYLNLLFNLNLSIFLSINIISIRLILCFSSIVHISWIIFLLLINCSFIIFYFLIYSIINFFLIFLLKKINLNYLTQITSINLNPKFLFIIILIIFSLIRIPPLLGFLIKWLFFQSTWNYIFIFLLLIIFYSLIFSYIYIRLIFNFIIKTNLTIKIFNSINPNIKLFNLLLLILNCILLFTYELF